MKKNIDAMCYPKIIECRLSYPKERIREDKRFYEQHLTRVKNAKALVDTSAPWSYVHAVEVEKNTRRKKRDFEKDLADRVIEYYYNEILQRDYSKDKDSDS